MVSLQRLINLVSLKVACPAPNDFCDWPGLIGERAMLGRAEERGQMHGPYFEHLISHPGRSSFWLPGGWPLLARKTASNTMRTGSGRRG